MAIYTVQIELTVTDRKALAAYAKTRAFSAKISEKEFSTYETQAYEDGAEIEYWLSWSFDGSQPGIDLQDICVTAHPHAA